MKSSDKERADKREEDKREEDKRGEGKAGSLKKSIMRITFLGVLAWCLLVSAAAYYSVRIAEKDRLLNRMESDVRQAAEKLDADYYSLIKMSQQMSAEGTIGKEMGRYLTEQEPYERAAISSGIAANMNTMLFNYEYQAVAGYIRCAAGEGERNFFFNLPPGEADIGDFPYLSGTGEIMFQGIHPCLNALSDREVISVKRHAVLGGSNYWIYVELCPKLEEFLKNLSEAQEGSACYTLAFLDDTGQVICSTGCSTESRIPDGTRLGKKGSGSCGGYEYVREEGEFGFEIALLLPRSVYLSHEYRWQFTLLLIGAAGLISIATVASVLFYSIYRPVRQMGRDIENMGRGDLKPVSHSFGLCEFDRLTEQFNKMKNEIVKLMEEKERSAYEIQQLEIDKLYYQINPHFLMNTLNSLHWMAAERRQTEIDDYICRLNFILGYSLGKIYRSATLGTEFKSLDMYLELQKKRYDFQVHRDVQIERRMEMPCARLILQPLAENAVCHNMDAFGNLWISAREKEGKICIEIRDDGKGIRALGGREIEAKRLNQGIGLRYVELSLRAYYGGGARLMIRSRAEEGTAVTIELPLTEDEDVQGTDY